MLRKYLLGFLTLPLLVSCASTDYATMSKSSGVSKEALTAYCPEISCSFDKLKDKVQATANDMNTFLALGGVESRTIQFTWVSGTNYINVDVFAKALYGSWLFVDSAEIYVGKEMVAELNGGVDRVVGTYNEVAGEHEKIEMISGTIPLAKAERIAQANYEGVTIRFYGKNGYNDVELPREHSLINVVKLAQDI